MTETPHIWCWIAQTVVLNYFYTETFWNMLMTNADTTLRLADLAVERGCYLPLLPKQRLAADKARGEMEGYEWNDGTPVFLRPQAD